MTRKDDDARGQAAHHEAKRKAKAIRRDQLIFQRAGQNMAQLAKGLQPFQFRKECPDVWTIFACAWCFVAVATVHRPRGELRVCHRACNKRIGGALSSLRRTARRHGVLDTLTAAELMAVRKVALDPHPAWERGVRPVKLRRGHANEIDAEPAEFCGACPSCEEPFTLANLEIVNARKPSAGAANCVENVVAICRACRLTRGSTFPDDCDVTGERARAIVTHMEAHRDKVKPVHLAATRSWARRQEALDEKWRRDEPDTPWLDFVRRQLDTGGAS